MTAKPWKRRSWLRCPYERRIYERSDLSDDEDVVDLTALAGTWTIDSNTAPAGKVFATYELLEQILLAVLAHRNENTMRTVLVAQRVNRNFQQVIERSDRVQQMLFLKPTPSDPNETTCGKKDPHRSDWNPLLGFWAERSGQGQRLKMRRCGYKADPFKVYDFVQINDRYFHIPRAPKWQTWSRFRTIPYQQGSWRRMLLCQWNLVGKALTVIATTPGSLYINRQRKKVEGEKPKHIEIVKEIEVGDTLGGIMDMISLRARGQNLGAHGHNLSTDDWDRLHDDDSDGGIPLSGYI